MNNAISRRSFLKCAGATALAAGAASMLSGCDLLDKAMGSLIGRVGEASGIAMCKMGGTSTEYAMVTLRNDVTWWKSTASHETLPENTLLAVGFTIQVKNYQNKEITLKASDITDVTVNGHKAKVLTDTDSSLATYTNSAKYNEDGLFKKGDSKTYKAAKDTSVSVDGHVFFELVYANAAEAVKGDWNNIKFTLKLNGDTKTFELTKNGDGTTSKVV